MALNRGVWVAMQALTSRTSGRRISLGRTVAFLPAVLLCMLVGIRNTGPTHAATDGYTTINLTSGFSLRQISKQYLGDPDLWPVILRVNGFRKVTELSAGSQIRIPESAAKLSGLALRTSLEEIQRANENGAQLFAPKLISAAVNLRDQALTTNKNGDYVDSIDFSNRSIVTAEKAREKSVSERNQVGEARLNDRYGWVEGQKPEENAWADRPLNTILIEQEKLRTLSKSTAQVIFRDGSRLRLNANSQAVIEKIRADPLKRQQESQISLVEGDFYAVLAAESSRDQLEINIPEVSASIDSGNFWVSHDKTGAKFTNYDVQPVSITAQDQTIELGRNEGVFVRSGEAPKDKIEVRAPVELDQPGDGTVVFKNPVLFEWKAVDGAVGYWVEVAFDSRFDRLRESAWGLENERYDQLELSPGTYFWRVAALDAFGLPGARSLTRKFEVKSDAEPPFLQIRTPKVNSVLRKAQVTVSGDSEPGAEVLVGGKPASIDDDGRFFVLVNAIEGNNVFDVIARDPAGNETVKEVRFVYLKDERSDIVFDSTIPRTPDGVFLTSSNVISLSGISKANADIAVIDQDGKERSRTISEASGGFALNVPIVGKRETLEFRITTVSGYAYDQPLSLEVRDTPPGFKFNERLPRVTGDEILQFTARTDSGASVTMNGQVAPVEDGLATFSVRLVEGVNLLEFVITNQVGLVSVEKRTVVFDRDAPAMVNFKIGLEPRGEQNFYSLRLKAKDRSGLAKTARFKVVSGGSETSGVLRFNRARKMYTGSIEIAADEAAAQDFFIVELADVAGNTTEVTLKQ